ncbi:hypothetical protein R3P38DRAFT_2803631 [Favolaschia claudopus]|uniref:Uncharacterized protein n=1 Tax=Favolaschia claudopus TaxID=2862362 RepID=A0AAV9ZRG8_9AGAR
MTLTSHGLSAALDSVDSPENRRLTDFLASVIVASSTFSITRSVSLAESTGSLGSRKPDKTQTTLKVFACASSMRFGGLWWLFAATVLFVVAMQPTPPCSALPSSSSLAQRPPRGVRDARNAAMTPPYSVTRRPGRVSPVRPVFQDVSNRHGAPTIQSPNSLDADAQRASLRDADRQRQLALQETPSRRRRRHPERPGDDERSRSPTPAASMSRRQPLANATGLQTPPATSAGQENRPPPPRHRSPGRSAASAARSAAAQQARRERQQGLEREQQQQQQQQRDGQPAAAPNQSTASAARSAAQQARREPRQEEQGRPPAPPPPQNNRSLAQQARRERERQERANGQLPTPPQTQRRPRRRRAASMFLFLANISPSLILWFSTSCCPSSSTCPSPL